MNLRSLVVVCFLAASTALATQSGSAESPAIAVVVDFRGDDTGALVLNILDWVAIDHHFLCQPGPSDFLNGQISGRNGDVVRVPYLLDEIEVRCAGQSTGYVTASKHSRTRLILSGYYETGSAVTTDQIAVDEIMARVVSAIKGHPQVQHIDQTTYLPKPTHLNIK